MDQVVWTIFVHFYFFKDHAALAGDVVGVKDWAEYEIAENIERDGDMLIENFDVEADTFLGGEGVHVAADRVDLAGDGFGGAVLRALEHHVLDKMRDAIPFSVFIAGARFQPDADGNRAEVRHLLRDHGQAIRQRAAMNVAGLFYH